MKIEERPRLAGRFLVVGVTNTIFSYGIFVLLHHTFSDTLHYMLVLIMAYAINVSFSFFTQAVYVFRSQQKEARAFARFNVVTLASFAANALILHLLVKLSIPPLISQLIAVLGIAMATFFIHQGYTFRRHRTTND